MKKIDNIIVKILYIACTFLMVVMLVDIVSEVISRYALGSPLTWSEELGRYTFVWMSFLGMAVGIRQGSHVALDILVTKLKGVSKKTLLFINNLLLIVFGVVLTYSGYNLMQIAIGQYSPTLKLPMEGVYTVIPISGLFLLYFVISEMIQMFRKGDAA